MSDSVIVENIRSDQEKTKTTGKKKAEAIASILLIAFSAYMIVESLSMPINAEYGPGPGMFPLGLGIILLVLSLVLLWENINPRTKDKASKFQNKRGLLASGLMVLGLVGYTLLITKLGYVITTLLLVLYLMGVVARDKLKTTVLTAIGVTLLLFLIFDIGLGVHLPQGPFGF